MTSSSSKRGRPKADEPGSSVSTWLRAGEHDQLIRLARQHERTVSSLVRELLKLQLPARNTPTK
jgi:hypothetical protein